MDERFTQANGTHVYTGCELLVKGALESGVSLLTGYPGSPLAEVFDIIQDNAELLKTNGIVRTDSQQRGIEYRAIERFANGGCPRYRVYEKCRLACCFRCTRN